MAADRWEKSIKEFHNNEQERMTHHSVTFLQRPGWTNAQRLRKVLRKDRKGQEEKARGGGGTEDRHTRQGGELTFFGGYGKPVTITARPLSLAKSNPSLICVTFEGRRDELKRS